MKFPAEMKDFASIEDAKSLFRLANTQFKRALDYFVLDGFVTEHVQMKQDLSKLYKQLSQMESDKDRFVAMQERRRELLEPIIAEVNPKAFENVVMEIGVELADIYSAMFDVMYESQNKSGKPLKKSETAQMNANGLKSIQYSKQVCEIILRMEDKFTYAQAIMNQQLSVARIYSKLQERDDRATMKNLECSYREYEFLSKFMKEYMKAKEITDPKELPKGMYEPYVMMNEMVELMPVKISKLNAVINSK